MANQLQQDDAGPVASLPAIEINRLREIVQGAAHSKQLTPDVVAAFAKLHLVTDQNQPVEPAAHHWLWLRLMCDERIKRLLILAPPESAKTTWLVSAYAGCHIGIWPQRSIIIGSSSGHISMDRSQTLRILAESQEWQATFPGITRAKGMMWDSHKWSIAPMGIPYPGRLHPTVAAYGPEGSIIGSRAHLVIGDDIVDYPNSRTKAMREIISGWVHTSLISRMHSNTGRLILIGTTWHPDDVYSELKARGDFVVCRVPILSDSVNVVASITWPDGWEYERLGDAIAGQDETGQVVGTADGPAQGIGA